MTGAAASVLSVALAADRQTIMLRAFWMLVVAAGLVSIGAWILLAREIRVQRRRRGDVEGNAVEVDGDGSGGGEDALEAAEADEDGKATGHSVEVPADTADVGDPGDHP
ncbi:MAG TPA: hypothetical protein VEM41_10515 [Actinomycetota bacterium]|jgi:uncharacterized membrane protein YedE/YeeE|nr:hypothetical protein [Actinomycetota bacterium]